MYCRKCGKEITQYDKFCPKCGTQNVDFASEIKIDETSASKPKATNKANLIRWIATGLCAIIGTVILYSGFGAMFIMLGMGVFQKGVYATQHLYQMYNKTMDLAWMWIFVFISVILFILNLVVLIKNKRKKIVLNILSVLLSGLFVFWGIAFGHVFCVNINEAKEMVMPSLCLIEHFTEDETNSILKSLEQYGFYDPDTDYQARIECADAYQTLTITDENGKEKTSFTISEHYTDEFFYAEGWVLENGDWIAVVEDGEVSSIYLRLNDNLYPFVEEGQLTQNPEGNFIFASIISHEANHSMITSVIENRIVDEYKIDKEKMDFSWEKVQKDTLNSDIDLWESIIAGSFEANEKSIRVHILLSAKTDYEIETIVNDEDGLPFSISYATIDE